MMLPALALPVALAVSGVVVPKWEPTYNMTKSTVIMSCNYTGMIDPAVYRNFGLVDFDWSNAREQWTTATPMTCQEKLVEQAEAIKHSTPSAHVFVYRNLVKALPWYTQVREKITDPNYSGWFLHFDPNNKTAYHQPKCTGDKCSDLYHDQEQVCRHKRNTPQQQRHRCVRAC